MVELEHGSQGTQVNMNMIPLNNFKYNKNCKGDAIINFLLPHSQ